MADFAAKTEEEKPKVEPTGDEKAGDEKDDGDDDVVVEVV